MKARVTPPPEFVVRGCRILYSRDDAIAAHLASEHVIEIGECGDGITTARFRGTVEILNLTGDRSACRVEWCDFVSDPDVPSGVIRIILDPQIPQPSPPWWRRVIGKHDRRDKDNPR